MQVCHAMHYNNTSRFKLTWFDVFDGLINKSSVLYSQWSDFPLSSFEEFEKDSALFGNIQVSVE